MLLREPEFCTRDVPTSSPQELEGGKVKLLPPQLYLLVGEEHRLNPGAQKGPRKLHRPTTWTKENLIGEA